MAWKLAEMFVEVGARDEKMKRDLNRTKGHAMQIGRQIQTVMGAFGVGLGLAALVRTSQNALTLAERQVNAEQRLRAAVKATGGAAGFTSDELLKMSSALQKVTTVGDEQIQESMALLTTFKNVQGSVFTRATKAALDLSATGFGSVSQATVQLGKALEDPQKGLGALARVGVSFSAQQQEHIKGLVAQGKLYEAQAKLLEAVEGQVKGVSQEMAKTPFGRMKQLNNLIDDQWEIVGQKLVPAMNRWREIKLKLLELFIKWADRLKWLTSELGSTTTRVYGLSAGLTLLSLNMKRVTFWSLKLVPSLRKVKFALAGTGIGLFVVALGAVVARLGETETAFEKFSMRLPKWLGWAFGIALNKTGWFFGMLKNVLLSGFKAIGQSIKLMLSGQIDKAIAVLTGFDLAKSIKDEAMKVGGDFAEGFREGLKGGAMPKLFDDIKDAAEEMPKDPFGGVADSAAEAAKELEKLTGIMRPEDVSKRIQQMMLDRAAGNIGRAAIGAVAARRARGGDGAALKGAPLALGGGLGMVMGAADLAAAAEEKRKRLLDRAGRLGIRTDEDMSLDALEKTIQGTMAHRNLMRKHMRPKYQRERGPTAHQLFNTLEHLPMLRELLGGEPTKTDKKQVELLDEVVSEEETTNKLLDRIERNTSKWRSPPLAVD